ncbi:MAG TPA: hypothetical protein G4O16_04195 [Dehalococcoidia bacterium]|nr:hypothetical protein [Dehalococcoidia bacterium]
MIGKYIKKTAARLKDETGMALIIVLVLLLLGSIALVPVLAHINDALKTGTRYEEKSKELYTADSGIEDGLWRIKYDYMGAAYDKYDYYNTFPYETELVNGLTANVTIRNVWFPSNVAAPSPDDAKDIIESEKLLVVGTSGGIIGAPYTVRIDFTPDSGDNLTVKSLGVWLPQGFEYITDNCSLMFEGPFEEYYPDYINVNDAPGGSTVVWGYNPPYPNFTSFPEVDPEATPITLDFTFGYTPPAETPTAMPAAIAWITTEMTQGEFGFTNPNDVPLSWDVDTRFFEIVSNTGDVTVQAFSSKCELRQMGDAMSGDYVAIGGSLLSDDDGDMWGIRETWHTPSSYNLNTIPENADAIAAYLYWAGWRNEASKTTLIQDSCDNIDTFWSYSSPTGWEANSGQFKGHYYGDGNDSRLLTLKNDMDLSSYAPGSIIITFDYGSEVNAVVFADDCDNFNSWDNGGDWSITSNSFKAHSTQPDTSSTRWLTLKTGLVDLSGFSGGEAFISWDRWEEVNLDNGDSLWYAFSGDNGSSWSGYTRVFRNDFSGVVHDNIGIPSAYLTNGFKVRLLFYGFDYWQNNLYIDNIEISGTGSLSEEDGLDIAVSGDDGTSWSNNVEVFRGDQGSFMREFVYVVPDEYTTADFKLRFEVIECGDLGEKARIDNIKIINCPVDTEIVFKIDGEQVYFDGSNPESGSEPLVAGRSYVMLNTMWGSPEGFSYACTRDVTALVKKYPEDPGEEHHPGNAVYTVDGVSANPGNNFSFAGWSLIIVYASPDTAGHYIYIRDDNFAFHPGDDEFLSLDFDDDGQPGGDITNFIVPEPIRDEYGVITETVAAKITCFVAEGDSFGTSSITITGQASGLTKELWNLSSPFPDVWNGESYPGTYEEGVDIDTFELLWTDNILTPDDNILHVDMYSYNDAWNLVYFIISVRSETTTGGTSHYVIYG